MIAKEKDTAPSSRSLACIPKAFGVSVGLVYVSVADDAAPVFV